MITADGLAAFRAASDRGHLEVMEQLYIWKLRRGRKVKLA